MGIVGSSSVYNSTIINVGNGWYRCIVSFQLCTINNVRIGLTTVQQVQELQEF